MARDHVGFPGSRGARLAGRIDSPEGEATAYALFAHCFTCSKDLRSAGIICRELTARGIAVLRFDFTGLGASGGEFADTNFSSNVEDLIAAVDFLRRERRAPVLLVGHSLGGTAMLAAAARIPEARAVATIGAPSDTSTLRAKLAARLAPAAPAVQQAAPRTEGEEAEEGKEGREAEEGREGQEEVEEEPSWEVHLGGLHPVRIRRQLLDDLAGDHLGGAVAGLGKALLLLHSPADRVVGIEHAERLFMAARYPKSFVSLGDADHLLSDPRDAAQAGAVLAAWAMRYLPAPEAASGRAAALPGEAAVDAHAIHGTVNAVVTGTGIPALPATLGPSSTDPAEAAAAPASGAGEPASDLAPGEVEVTGTAPALRQEVRAGGHRLVVDEPRADGGTDAGATPYGFLLAALGACTGITLRLYADRKGIPLTGTRVRLRHSRDHRTDCEDCATRGTMLERIDREIELSGPLTAEQRARLAAIADRCPVHRTLTSRVEIATRVL